MLGRKIRNITDYHEIILQNFLNLMGKNTVNHPTAAFSTGSANAINYLQLPKKLRKSERKPLVTSVTELKRKARRERKMRQQVHEITLQAPENGMLVKSLVPVAHKVYAARTMLFNCVSRLVNSIPIYTCSLCGEVNVGCVVHKIRSCNVAGSPSTKEHSWERGGVKDILPIVECFHLYDRVGRAVSHKERFQVDRIPAVVELCVQAGVDIPEYPTRRRAFPVYNVAGRMIDFEQRFPKDDLSGKDIEAFGFWKKKENPGRNKKSLDFPDDLRGLAARGMEAWENMRSGALKLMQKYAVQTCGYCPEVQVGPKGHRVRQCQAFKHQMRDGQHAWQEATFDDFVPPVYVWHVQQEQSGRPLVDGLKRYYGKLPAAVELFSQAGAHVGEAYASVMREDVVVPGLDEEKWVV
ncbi:APO protein 3, mitochondrial-like isoform X2 [Macadamia integrifolia]|nr:APO protein 3, mitochondrial-like isoform X2 [Macadamia integrifolia]